MDKSVDLRQLRYFIAVAEHQSFTRAARALHISQPPLSRQIQQLEERIGTRLLDRKRTGASLTRAGRHFLEEAQAIFVALQEAAASTAAIGAGELGSVTIGFTSTALYGDLPSIVRSLRSTQPSLRLVLTEMTVIDQLTALRAERIDLAIALAMNRESDIHQQVLSTEQLAVCLPAGHRLASSSRPLAVTALAKEGFISFPRDLAPGLFDAIAGFLAGSAVPFNITQEAVQMQTIIGLVSTGLGVAIVPSSMSQLQRPGVVYRRLSPAPPAIVTQAAWLKSQSNPALDRVLELIG
ncbi:MAG: LysR family transcriptional regulator, partial [Pseudomonadota bacterium]